MIKWAKDKPINLASPKRLQRRFNSLSKKKKEKKRQKKVSLSIVNKALNKYLSKSKNIKKVFFLSTLDKIKRMEFLQFMKKNNIYPDNIFFTDESIFNLSSYFNKNFKIRISKKTQRLIKNGNEVTLKKVAREFYKKENAIMISGGICNKGLGKLIFHSGNVNTFAYKKILNFYREDMDKFPGKYFQQDGARAHSSKGSQEKINLLFKVHFIPTWESGPEINGQKITKWPPNSPDLSAIELIWSIIKGMLNMFPPTTLEELKITIQKIWNSISPEICEKIIDHIKKRWELCIQHKERRLDKELLRKISSDNNKEIKIKFLKSKINRIRISYNDKFVIKLKNKDIKEKNRKLKNKFLLKINLK